MAYLGARNKTGGNEGSILAFPIEIKRAAVQECAGEENKQTNW